LFIDDKPIMAVLPPIARILATNVGYPFIMPAKVRLCMYSSPLIELHNNIITEVMR